MGFTESLVRLNSFTPKSAVIHNVAWGRIVTPLLPQVWKRELERHPDKELADYVCMGIKEGFRI